MIIIIFYFNSLTIERILTNKRDNFKCNFLGKMYF